MKLLQQLTVAGKVYPLIKDDVRLALNTPGRACFTVQATEPLKGSVIYQAGWTGQALRYVFVGTVANSATINHRTQQLYCRELTAVLHRPLELALRHVTLPQVLDAIHTQTQLTFVTPEAAYTQEQAAYFYSLASGYKAMDDLAKVYQIPNFIWQQQEDGTVYVGSWQESSWAMNTVELPDQLLTEHVTGCSATIGLMPALRVGVKTNRGRINSVTLQQHKMDIEWTPLDA